MAKTLKDFEDGVQAACANINELHAIVTHNGSDFAGVSLPIFSATELVIQVTLTSCGLRS